MDKVSGSILAHEARLVRQADDHVEKEKKALHIRGETSRVKDSEKTPFRCRGRGFSQGRAYGRGRGTEYRQHQGQQRNYRGNVQCYLRKKFGNIKMDYWYRDRVVEEKEVCNLFMAQLKNEERATLVWPMDSGCFNHMSGSNELFQDLDKSQKITVRLGDDKEIQVLGKGIVSLVETGSSVWPIIS